MTDKKQPICRECHILFPSWNELAKHIVANQDSHPSKSVVFAYHVLSEVDNVREFKPRMPMSPELKQAVKECRRELSGEMAKGQVKCPVCGVLYHAEIEIEHLQGMPLRDNEGALLINCSSCRASFYSGKKVWEAKS
jgi:hypothetical protein